MTTNELIQALRMCVGCTPECNKCPMLDDEDCVANMRKLAADRLQTMLAERKEMEIQIQKEICKRVDVEKENERLKVGKDTADVTLGEYES